MKLDLGVVCDAANVTANGKLNICGEFNAFNIPSEPGSIAQFVLVLRILGYANEVGTHTIGIRFVDSDANPVWTSPDAPFEVKPLTDGIPYRMHAIFPIIGLPLPTFGPHAFEVFLDGQRVAQTIDVYIRQTPQP